ncbi:MAG: dihydropteroate synthase [Fusobacteriaceae bacterium]|jgi:dihydropteroate synthase|nr:dihydropteroate synthase [Fusobacteriaceae bacterium]
MIRPLKCREKRLILGERTLLMGILNLTPDSSSDGGSHATLEAALAHARQMITEGADIIDVGGESTRPGYERINDELEIARILPLIRALREQTDIVISVDTYKYRVAEAALAAGAHMVNDIWGLQADAGEMAGVVARYGAGLTVMHNRESVEECVDLMVAVAGFFEKSKEIAGIHGICRESLLFDPGVGFGKTANQNWEILRRLGELTPIGPLLLGTSRKGFLGKLTGEAQPKQRDAATLATSVAAVAAGAEVLRVHNIKANKAAIAVADKLYRS